MRGGWILGRLAPARTLALALVALGAAGGDLTAAGEDEPLVRVLLYKGPGPVRVAERSGPRRTVVAGGSGLEVDGRAVGDTFRLGAGAATLEGVRYRGSLQFLATEAGLTVVNQVPLESYVAGSVPQEVYTSWSAPVLRAQAVVTRTYALHRMGRRRAVYDLTADTSSQRYGGLDAEAPTVSRAVEHTRGEYLAHDGRPILAAYHSDSGGRTATAEEVWGRAVPYLVSVEVEGEEDSPHTYWRTSLSSATLDGALEAMGFQLGPVQEMRVVERSRSGRVRRVRVRGQGGTALLEGRQLRRILGQASVRSTVFELHGDPDGFVFVGTGNGHGVGMSQWGARAMARTGSTYREILQHFYPGTRLRRLPESSGSAVAAGSAGR